MDINDILKCEKNTNIYYKGVNIRYPFQMNIHQLSKDEFIECLYDLFHRNEKNEYTNFEEMLYGKFGKGITEKFLKPYNEKLYACHLNELDTDAMGRFFPYANPEQIIDNMKCNHVDTYNSTFDYPKKGAQFFVNILLKKIERNKIIFDAKVDAIDIANKVLTVNGEKYHYDKLINTMPLNRFVELLSDDEKRIVEGSLSCNKVLVFNLGFDKKAIDKKIHWTYFPDKDINFYRAGYYSNILQTDRLSMYIEIGYRENENIDIERQLNLTLNNLRKLGIITDHNLVSYNTLIINPGYVHITEDSIKKVSRLKEILKKKNVYTIGRYGSWTYCSIEDCMLEALSLIEEKDE